MNCHLFHLPKSVTVPMSIPISFGVKEAEKYLKIKQQFKEVDSGRGSLQDVRNYILDLMKRNENQLVELASLTLG
jgi:hypothetical protein